MVFLEEKNNSPAHCITLVANCQDQYRVDSRTLFRLVSCQQKPEGHIYGGVPGPRKRLV